MALPDTKSKEAAFWCDQIIAYEREFKTWEERSEKIVKKYTDKEQRKGGAQFNILWSNVQTLQPALYASLPKPNIDRRFQDDDDLGRIASQVLERSTKYFINQDVDDVMTQIVRDRLLPGRGVAWVRYVPQFKDAIANDAQSTPEQATDDLVQDSPDLISEDAVVDYVHWKDYGHTVARTEQEVRAKWRIVRMDRESLIKRFPKYGAKIPLDSRLDTGDKKSAYDRAAIYEIWDKKTRKVIWLHKACDELLDKQDDFLHLKGFFPCPNAVYSTLGNDNLVPTPDYVLYQDQARELNELTAKIETLTRAVRIIGVYDKTAQGLSRMLSEGAENKMIPVESWAVLGDKGGLKGVVDFFPLDMVINALNVLQESRDKVIQIIYQITGISDIIRGATNAAETATAQQIKGQYAQLRLGDMQKGVARFARDLVQIIAEIIAEHFSLETIKQLSGMKLLTDVQKKEIALLQQSGQPVPPDAMKLMALPSWEQVEAVIRDDAARSFLIDIETDSTIKADQEAEKKSRTEFLSASGAFIQQALQAPPELQPLLMEMLLFGVRGFKVGREMETQFKAAMDKIREKAENPQPPQQDPQIAIEQERAQKEVALKDRELGLKEREVSIKEKDVDLQHEQELARISAEVLKAKYDAKAKMPPEMALSDPEMHGGGVSPLAQVGEIIASTLGQGLQQIAIMQNDGLQKIAQAQAEGNAAIGQAVVAAASVPRKAVKSPDGTWTSQPIING